MKQRIVTTPDQLADTAKALSMLGDKLPLVVTVTQGKKIRTNGMNSRYWSNLSFFMSQIDEAVERFAEQAGYTNFEARKIIAGELAIEHAAILFMRKSEATHECLKMICNIPTSTRLGTKAFQKYELVLEQTMAEILGSVNSAIN